MCRLFLLTLAVLRCSLAAARTLQFPIQDNLISPAVDRHQIPVSSHGDEDLSEQTNSPQALRDMLSAIEVMQDTYFSVYGGTWPDAIDWTAAVMGTHVSATLSSLVLGLDARISKDKIATIRSCADRLSWENIVNKYFTQTALFYFGENAFALRNQAYDDMLWVVLGWLENIKFAEMYSRGHWEADSDDGATKSTSSWHGVQMTGSAAHRARIFYELASTGWGTKLCKGGMVWNPNLTPYKNAITNELFTAASIGMYLYFPGDNNTSPFIADDRDRDRGGNGHAKRPTRSHDPMFLDNAVKSYKWLKDSGMQSKAGLYQDGFHVSGWTRFRNGTIDPGSGQCDELNTMVYTYNQGVLLSASRGLWLATGAQSYLDDGHYLINSVINATGWHQHDHHEWHGLGRGGVLEEFCDHRGYCSQDGQTFKGIFFHHLTEFCRPLWPQEEDYISIVTERVQFDKDVYHSHLEKCASYGEWIEHNANAALKTRNKQGLFGMWWGVSPRSKQNFEKQDLPPDAEDHLNPQSQDGIELNGQDMNERGRGRTVETQSGGLAVLRAHWQWHSQWAAVASQ